jgi:alkylation response protein AidB-like acyl-CoA dehydrogenase
MEIGLSEAQQLLRHSARDFFERECPASLVREVQASPRGFSRPLWDQLAALGWTGLLIPEAHGGSGVELTDAAILLEEVGRSLAPVPFASTAVLAARALQEFGTEAQQAVWLPRIAGGDLIAAIAITEPRATYTAEGIRTRAVQSGDEYLVDGTKLFVRDGTVAGLLLVAARTTGAADAEAGITVLLVNAGAPGVTITPLASSGRDRQAEIKLAGVRVPADRVLGAAGQGWPIVQRLIDLGALAECAEMVGAGQRVFEMTVEYAKTRVQFGRPIGSFQAIQHKIADMATDIDGSRLITHYAAWKASKGQDARADIARAKAWMSDAFRRITREAQQVHGGVGFIVDHDLHLFFNREKTAELYMGTPAHHRRTIADALLGPVGS